MFSLTSPNALAQPGPALFHGLSITGHVHAHTCRNEAQGPVYDYGFRRKRQSLLAMIDVFVKRHHFLRCTPLSIHGVLDLSPVLEEMQSK